MTYRNHRRSSAGTPAPDQTKQMEDRHQELIDALDGVEDHVVAARDILSDVKLAPKEKVARVGVVIHKALEASGKVVR